VIYSATNIDEFRHIFMAYTWGWEQQQTVETSCRRQLFWTVMTMTPKWRLNEVSKCV